jgi:hypothetical protein
MDNSRFLLQNSYMRQPAPAAGKPKETVLFDA